MLAKIVTLLFSLSLFFMQIPFFADNDTFFQDNEIFKRVIKALNIFDITFAIVLVVFMATLTIICTIIKSISAKKNPYKIEDLLHGILIIKLVPIAFFIIHFFIYTMLTAVFAITGVGIPITIAVGAIVAGCVLFVTSLYTILVLFRCYKMHLLSTKAFVLLVVTQFYFCIDIIGAVIGYFMAQRCYKQINSSSVTY